MKINKCKLNKKIKERSALLTQLRADETKLKDALRSDSEKVLNTLFKPSSVPEQTINADDSDIVKAEKKAHKAKKHAKKHAAKKAEVKAIVISVISSLMTQVEQYLGSGKGQEKLENVLQEYKKFVEKLPFVTRMLVNMFFSEQKIRNIIEDLVPQINNLFKRDIGGF